jgi:hypothetical protein
MLRSRSIEAGRADGSGTGGGPTGRISPGGDEAAKEVGSSGCVGNSCKAPSPSDDDESYKEACTCGAVCYSCKDPSLSDGDEAYKSGGNSGEECEVVDPSASGGEEGEVVDPSAGGEEGEAVAPSDLDWCRSSDMTATFPTAVGTATSSRASYISRTTGAASTRLEMERMRRF